MAKVIKQCRVCGKDYEYCHTFKRTTLFRWQDVACSPECGNIYFERVLAARSGQVATQDKPSEIDNIEIDEFDEDEFDEEFELDFDDEEDFE